MRKETYLNYIKYTLSTYNKVSKKELLKKYKDKNLVKKKDMQPTLFDDGLVDIDYSNLEDTLFQCIEKNDVALEIYEKFQFVKSYKYSVLFKSTDFNKLIEMSKKIPEYQFKDDDIKLFDDLSSPKKIETEDLIIIRFNKKYEAVHPQTAEELLLHYPVLVVLHKDVELVEFRFDAIKRLFIEGTRDQAVYTKLIDDIIEYFNRNDLGILEALDLKFMIEITKSDDIDNIKLLSQYMFLKNGGKAQLTVGNNEEYVLPIIGELKNIMNKLEDELSKNIRIKDALEQFIYEKEETTDYPWIEVLFLDSEGIKTRNNHVKFTFNYMNKKYSLITYYYNDTLVEMERMNNVTRFIGKNFK